ncbi:nucleotidyltransferase family protein [Halomonas sp. McH1-25]|uniref:nucleotidyltransferase family protein n=1 Tax=unclassified Halomonas TaxID=2609666 RepID=UPI001EF46C0D|nr:MULTISPECIES: nucleotidyltransferase family protein [unclassified Halomonas]MCG7601541.1 nucleotidyltransferase family protein [Halomonas sp. McH1-25]MCP1343339.1 nucleotidyltransferase family protein [Halomonas sp. FL8]MCP1363392.1 nucleotidyltransferase family protein [Halomonas sp. BBD45]MCP1367239.1 nucleotidyltransferase family protein [Halomonas sp. BBD48]
MSGPPAPTRVIALVLAAGHSRRFGTDKRRARLDDGRPLLAATLGLAMRCFEEVWVVLRQSEQPAELGIDPDCTVVQAPGDAIGLGTSLGAGARALIEAQVNATAVAVMLGDMPWIQPATCQALKERASPERIVRPRHAGQPGHPVLFGCDFWPDMARLRGDRGARDVLSAHAAACRYIDVDDPGILLDIDVPADLDC